jgi:hypothetical protein
MNRPQLFQINVQLIEFLIDGHRVDFLLFRKFNSNFLIADEFEFRCFARRDEKCFTNIFLHFSRVIR